MSELDENENQPSGTIRHKVVALYKFVVLPEEELKLLQAEVEQNMRLSKARGTILLAAEGLNGTICYPESDNGDQVLDFLNNHVNFQGLRTRISYVDTAIFHRLKVKIKKEIVTIGGKVDATDDAKKPIGYMSSCTIDPTKIVGSYVQPGKEWDDLLEDPDIVVIDTRNKYEIDIGTFENAISPNTDNFRQFPDWLHRFAEECGTMKVHDQESSSKQVQCVENPFQADEEKGTIHNARCLVPVPDEDMPKVNRKPKGVAMFCTGGIRCEKSTSYTIAAKVFPPDVPVYHLDGGVLAYLDAHPDEENSKWKGECYVFDQRVAVTHGLKPSLNYTCCHACRRPISAADKERSDYIEGVGCRFCKDHGSNKQKTRFEERQKQIGLAKEKGAFHIHDPKYLKKKL